jgi:hypothetical protein
MYEMHEPVAVGIYAGLESLKEFIAYGLKAKLGENAGPPLVSSVNEMDEFHKRYRIPHFTPDAYGSGKIDS